MLSQPRVLQDWKKSIWNGHNETLRQILETRWTLLAIGTGSDKIDFYHYCDVRAFSWNCGLTMTHFYNIINL